MTRVLKTTVLAVALGSLGALAAPPADGSGDWGPGGGRRAHVARLVAISQALQLSDAEALKLGQKLTAFEAQRQPLHDQLRAGMATLRSAAQGDAAAGAQLDATLQKLADTRAQLQAMNREQFAQLSAGLNPQQKAKLALALVGGGRGHGMRGMMGHGRWGGPPAQP